MPTTASEEKPSQHPLWLTFNDGDLEKEFRMDYESQIRAPLRAGLVISILSWLSAIPLTYMVRRDMFMELSIETIIAILPFFLFVTYATMGERFKGWIHILGAFTNAWAGLYVIYLCSYFPNGANFMLPVLIFIIFFGSYMVRLRWVAGFFAALLYVLAYQIYMEKYSVLTDSEILLNGFICWLTLIFAILAGHGVEKNNRIRFIQRRQIDLQSKIIQDERDASERLLANLLPPFIAKRLKENESVIADNYSDASVMFIDLSGFTELSSRLPAHKIVELLNKIFSQFDRLTEQYELEKIKTIGDGYMVAGGLTKDRIEHLVRIADLSLEMLKYLETDNELKDLDLKIRIGINSGAVVAGVIGINKPTYDLWGATVNIASRMESAGVAGKINVSEVVKLRLHDIFDFEKREPMEIKGIGLTQMYFLLGRKDQ